MEFLDLRESLHNEVHARPYERLEAPARISHLACVTTADEQERIYEHVCRLLRQHHLPVPAAESSYVSADLGRFRLRWEKHTEFYTLTFMRPGSAESWAANFVDTALSCVPQDWLAALPGRALVALHVSVQPQPEKLPDAAELASCLDTNTLVGSHIGSGQVATVYTDYRLHGDRFGRILLLTKPMGTRRLGRSVQRLLEIETYRMMALLALPKAREVTGDLATAERELADITNRIQTVRREQEPQLLDQLTRLAGQTENLYASNHARFSAASAYYDLVQRRIVELNETLMPGLQTIGEFMERRLAPAMQTCIWATRRLQALSERISRASDLLRTRVDIEQEQQNQMLLTTMNKRQQLQLRLQETVEGLSVAAITYYAAGLVGYIAKSAKAFNVPLNAELVTGLSIPVIAWSVWRGLQKMRARLAREAAAKAD